MEAYRRRQFFFSPTAILKIVIVVVLLTALIFFLVDNQCPHNRGFVTMFVLPCVVCTCATLVTYITAVLVLVGRRNPLTTPTWVKGDVWFNVSAMVVMLGGSIITLTSDNGCVDFSLAIAAIAFGLIGAILFAICGAVTYLALVRHEEGIKETQRVQLNARGMTTCELE